MVDESTFKTIDIDSGNIPCSYGLAPILNKVVADYTSRRGVIYDYYVVNILTFVRNCFEATLTDNEILRNVNRDIEIYLYYMTNYISSLSNNQSKSVILLYVPTIYKVHTSYGRKLNKRNTKLQEICNKVTKMLPTKLNDISRNGVYIFTVSLRSAVLPYKQIIKYISRLSNTTKNYKGTYGSMLLFSHCALDFHIHQTFKKLFILESFTGAIKDYKSLGNKVFKVDTIPFNKYTHLAFGDSIHIDGPLKRNRKKAAIERSISHKWHLKTEIEIRSELFQCGIDINYFNKSF